MIQDSVEANKGFNVAPQKECERCSGHGFYYEDNWAVTCPCKYEILANK